MEHRDEHVDDWGIVGSRGRTAGNWYNHMPAAEVRNRLGASTWENYFKFCVIRNPFDKVVSTFWHDLAPDDRGRLASADFSVVQAAFREWSALEIFPNDRAV